MFEHDPDYSKLVNFASILEDNTRAQAQQSSTMPFIYPHIALMPDCHLGQGATVGSVIPTKGAIMPAAIGVDIGCGMIAVKTQFMKEDVLEAGPLSVLREGIEARVPVSKGVYNTDLTDSAAIRVNRLDDMAFAAGFSPYTYTSAWDRQLGTLGGGNHFIEVSVDENDDVWLFLHSGSRGIGNKIAAHHIKVAQSVAEKYFIPLPNKDLAYLVEGTAEFERYIAEMRWAQNFAWLNRLEMMDRTMDALAEFICCGIDVQDEVNCHHNYTAKEQHWGQSVWLSRKGAIDASEGVRGLIPGSMGDKSYVVVGKGNKMSLNSAPHGAGRVHSRKSAKAAFSLDDLKAAMGDIEYRVSDAFVDEIPAAYKSIDTVMQDAEDLVTVQHTLRQLVNVKGE